MPNVAGVEYPYTPQGISAAQQAERQIGRMGPSPGGFSGLGGLVGDPYISPGLLEMVRQRQQPTFESVSHRPEQPTFRDVSHRPQSWKDQMLDKLRGIMAIPGQVKQETSIRPGTGIRQNWQTDMFGNVVTNQFGNPATQQPNQSQPTTDFGQLIGRAVGGLPGLRQAQNPGVMFGQNPWQRPITQAPRGQTTNIGQLIPVQGMVKVHLAQQHRCHGNQLITGKVRQTQIGNHQNLNYAI